MNQTNPKYEHLAFWSENEFKTAGNVQYNLRLYYKKTPHMNAAVRTEGQNREWNCKIFLTVTSTNADRWFIWKGFCGRLIIQVISQANTSIRSDLFICWVCVCCMTVDLLSHKQSGDLLKVVWVLPDIPLQLSNWVKYCHNQMKRWQKVVMKKNIHFKGKIRHVQLFQFTIQYISSWHSLHPPTPDCLSIINKDRGSN